MLPGLGSWVSSRHGFPMTEARIKAMNEAGLQELQISIDGVTPDHVSNWSVVV